MFASLLLCIIVRNILIQFISIISYHLNRPNQIQTMHLLSVLHSLTLSEIETYSIHTFKLSTKFDPTKWPITYY